MRKLSALQMKPTLRRLKSSLIQSRKMFLIIKTRINVMSIRIKRSFGNIWLNKVIKLSLIALKKKLYTIIFLKNKAVHGNIKHIGFFVL